MLRPGRDDDAADFIALVASCWAEYPGCVFDLDGEVPELRALARHFRDKGGALWVWQEADRVAGMVAAWPADPPESWEIGKMYVDRRLRGGGVAATLLAQAEAHATARGAQRLELWSDSRFARAHAFYAKHGFVRSGRTRALGDKSHTVEYHFAKAARAAPAEQDPSSVRRNRRVANV